MEVIQVFKHFDIVVVWYDLLDNDDFVIPSLGIGDPDHSKTDVSEVEVSKPSSPKVSCRTLFCWHEEDYFIYLF